MFETVTFFADVQHLSRNLPDGKFLLLIGEKTDCSQLPLISKDVVGAIFPQVIYGATNYNEGIVAIKIAPSTHVYFFPSIQSIDNTLYKEHINSVFTIVDGLSVHLESFLEKFFEYIPEQSKMIGGGSGKLTLKQEPVIFDGHNFHQDAALLIASSAPIGIGVEHGYESLIGPFIASQTEGHTLKKINYKNAFDVYKNAVEEYSKFRFDEHNFFDISKNFPLGIVRFAKDFIVRDPIYTDGEAIQLVGNLDQNSVISILIADKDKLIHAAYKAACTSTHFSHNDYPQTIIVDCISRFLFLGESFHEELEAIASAYPKGTPLWGMLSLGEIANANQDSIEFYNKTCVVRTL